MIIIKILAWDCGDSNNILETRWRAKANALGFEYMTGSYRQSIVVNSACTQGKTKKRCIGRYIR